MGNVSPLAITFSTACILGGAGVAGYTIATQAVWTTAAIVASIALPVLGILVLVIALLRARSNAAAANTAASPNGTDTSGASVLLEEEPVGKPGKGSASGNKPPEPIVVAVETQLQSQQPSVPPTPSSVGSSVPPISDTSSSASISITIQRRPSVSSQASADSSSSVPPPPPTEVPTDLPVAKSVVPSAGVRKKHVKQGTLTKANAAFTAALLSRRGAVEPSVTTTNGVSLFATQRTKEQQAIKAMRQDRRDGKLEDKVCEGEAPESNGARGWNNAPEIDSDGEQGSGNESGCDDSSAPVAPPPPPPLPEQSASATTQSAQAPAQQKLLRPAQPQKSTAAAGTPPATTGLLGALQNARTNATSIVASRLAKLPSSNPSAGGTWDPNNDE